MVGGDGCTYVLHEMYFGGEVSSGGQRSEFAAAGQKTKTYNRRDSQMVTHSSTSRPVQCLCMAERTGCPVLTDLWSYVFMFLVDRICPIDKRLPSSDMTIRVHCSQEIFQTR